MDFRISIWAAVLLPATASGTRRETEDKKVEDEEAEDEETEDNPHPTWTHWVQHFKVPSKGIIKISLTNRSEMSTSPWNGDRIDIANVKVIKQDD